MNDNDAARDATAASRNIQDAAREAASYYDSLPQRQPMEALGNWGQQHPPVPVVPGHQQHGTGERPWVSPGRPPWDSQVHQDLAVQHGWPTPQNVIHHQAARPSSTVAVWALVLGCVGVLAGWCLMGVPCVIAVALGHVALAQTKDDRMSGRGMAVAGLVLGYVSLIPAIILIFWVAAGGMTGGTGAGLTTSP